MSVTDPDVPDPLNDPRTRQADPGAYGQGEDLASTADDAAATGQDELDAEPPRPTPPSADDPVGEDLVGGPLTGGGTTAGGVS